MPVKLSREWTIIDQVFQPWMEFEYSPLLRAVLRALRPLHKHLTLCHSGLYVRGSVLEERNPHPYADIDLFLVGPSQHHHSLCAHLRDLLHSFQRPIDIIAGTQKQIQEQPVFRLLLTTRSWHIAGPKHEFSPVLANGATAKSHWDIYAPMSLPDRLLTSGVSNACMVKQMVRSVAILYLVRHQRFSRHLPTCIKWANQIAPTQVFNSLQTSVRCIGKKQNPPIDIKDVKQWLCSSWTAISEPAPHP